MSKEASIKCSNCATQIDVNEILYHQLENEFKQKNLNEKKKFDEELKKATKELLKQEKQKLQIELKKELEEEQNESIALLKKELVEKSNQVKELNMVGMYVSIKGISGNVKALELPYGGINETI